MGPPRDAQAPLLVTPRDLDPSKAWSDGVTQHWLVQTLRCAGPGLMLGLANSSAGDLLAAAQSGAKYKFLYLAWVMVLGIPQYISTELVTRICVMRQAPLMVLINQDCGATLAVFALLVLMVSCLGGLVMQVSTFVAIGGMWGIGGVPVCLFVTAMFVSIVLSDSVSRMEKLGICLGIFELVFCVSAWMSKPDGVAMAKAVTNFPVTLGFDHTYITGAIIGAVLEPWVFFYQGSAVNRNRITEAGLDHERVDIILGTFASQATMGSILITFAVAMSGTGVDLDDVAFEEIPTFLESCMLHAKLVFSLGMLGASFVATLTIALTIAWAIEEMLGMGFLGCVTPEVEAMSSKVAFTGAVILVCVMSLADIPTISLILICDIVNSSTVILMVLLVLYLSQINLPQQHVIQGGRRALTFTVLVAVGICGCVSGLHDLDEVLSGLFRGSDTEAASMSLAMPKRQMSWRYSLAMHSSKDVWDSSIYVAIALPMVAIQFALMPAASRWYKSLT